MTKRKTEEQDGWPQKKQKLGGDWINTEGTDDCFSRVTDAEQRNFLLGILDDVVSGHRYGLMNSFSVLGFHLSPNGRYLLATVSYSEIDCNYYEWSHFRVFDLLDRSVPAIEPILPDDVVRIRWSTVTGATLYVWFKRDDTYVLYEFTMGLDRAVLDKSTSCSIKIPQLLDIVLSYVSLESLRLLDELLDSSEDD